MTRHTYRHRFTVARLWLHTDLCMSTLKVGGFLGSLGRWLPIVETWG